MIELQQSKLKNVGQLRQIPVQDENRQSTDILCTCVNTIFVILLLIICSAAFNNENLAKISFLNDQQGSICGMDYVDYPYLYYTSLTDATKRLCLKECPKSGDNQLQCKPTQRLSCSKNSNPKYEVNIYNTELENNRIGLICIPTDSEQKQMMLSISGLESKYNFLAFYDALWRSIWISAIFGIAFLIVLQCFPEVTIPWIVLLGGIIFIIFGLLSLILANGSITIRIIIFLFTTAIGIAILYSLYDQQRRKSIYTCGKMIGLASIILQQTPLLLIYLPLFMLFFMGLIALTGFQILASWSVGSLNFIPDYPIYQVKGFMSNFLTILIFIQFIWGMSALKQAFNFIISGYATNWYIYNKDQKQKLSIFTSPKLLICYHWGSVIGGSLMLFLFYFVDFTFDIIWPNDTQKQSMQKSKIRSRSIDQNRTCVSFFNLVRSQSMGYINLICVPYCNASRYCQLLSLHSNFYNFSQTTNRVYRLSAHALIISIVTLISIITMKSQANHSDIVGILFIVVICLFTITYFISLHGDLAQGILISIFIEQGLLRQQRNQRNQRNQRSSNKNENIISKPDQKVIQVYMEDFQANKQENRTILQSLYVDGMMNKFGQSNNPKEEEQEYQQRDQK